MDSVWSVLLKAEGAGSVSPHDQPRAVWMWSQLTLKVEVPLKAPVFQRSLRSWLGVLKGRHLWHGNGICVGTAMLKGQLSQILN